MVDVVVTVTPTVEVELGTAVVVVEVEDSVVVLVLPGTPMTKNSGRVLMSLSWVERYEDVGVYKLAVL